MAMIDIAPAEREASITLDDGRRLAWYEWGASNGRPVLFCTGAAMSGQLSFGAGVLADQGLRLLSIDRPGLGRSDPHRDKTLTSWVDDIRALSRQLRLGRFAVLGFSQGAPFALALAATDMVDAAAIVSAQDDFRYEPTRLQLASEVAAMVAAVADDKAQFEQHFNGFASADGMWELILAMSSPVDARLYGSEPFAGNYRRCLDAGFHLGPQAYVRDLANALDVWPFSIEAIEVPVALWFGRQDTSTVHSPDFGVTLARRLPNSSLTIDPDEGGSILWTQAAAILERLRR